MISATRVAASSAYTRTKPLALPEPFAFDLDTSDFL